MTPSEELDLEPKSSLAKQARVSEDFDSKNLKSLDDTKYVLQVNSY